MMSVEFHNSYVRRRDEKIFKKLAREHPLRYLFIELTRKCNLECVYCGSDCSPLWQHDELNSVEWIEILRQIAEDFHANEIMLAFTGGEPLIKPGFLISLAKLARLDSHIALLQTGVF